MTRFGIGSGHGGTDPGAVANGYKEAEIVRRITPLMIQFLKEHGHTVADVTSNKNHPENVREAISLSNKQALDYTIQNHINAGEGTGVEVWTYPNTPSADALAEKIAAAISKHYGFKNRGVKRSDKLADFLNLTYAPAIIIEWCFIDSPNNTDIKKLTADISGGVKAVVEAITGKKVITNPETALPTQNPLYRVRKSKDDARSQIGAYTILENARKCRDEANIYHIFDRYGNLIE